MYNPESVTLTSADLTADRLAALKALIPEAFTEGSVDFAKLREALGDIVDDGSERYNFTWAGKHDAIRVLQAPTSATLVPCQEESVNWDTTQHLFIEGDNLEVLKLLYKPYFGKVKLIYIDPPYNTGNDFIYPDNYADPLDFYMRFTGQRDAEGNDLSSEKEKKGRYHSRWLTMMYPRLFFARQLMREDGVIFISIDDGEVSNLRKICDEIFGEENFVSAFVWNSSTAGGIRPKYVSQCHEYALMYAKSKESLDELYAPLSPEAVKQYVRADKRGPYREKDFAWRNPSNNENQKYAIKAPDGSTLLPGPGYIYRFVKESFEQAKREGLVVFKETDTSPLVDHEGKRAKFNIYVKKYLGTAEGAPASIPPKGLVGLSSRGSEEIKSLFEDVLMFTNPKSTDYLSYLFKVGLEDIDSPLILDFFAGSGTTAHVVLNLNQQDGGNRRFILVQLPEPTCHTGYPTIADITKERVRRVIQQLGEKEVKHPSPEDLGKQDLGFRAFKLTPSHFRDWIGVTAPTSDEYLAQMDAFADPLFAGFDAHSIIWEVAIKEGFSLTSRIETVAVDGHAGHRVSDTDSMRYFHICLDAEVKSSIVAALGLADDDLFICRDLAIDDTTAANLALQCRLKTI